jgi:DNA-binding YbaB/EbfC family protein
VFQELASLAGLMKQMQGLGGRMEQAKARLAEIRCTGSDPTGQVQVEASGQGAVLSCRIAPAFVTAGDTARLEAAVTAAVNEALTKVRESTAAELGQVAGGINLGGMADMLTMALGKGPGSS